MAGNAVIILHPLPAPGHGPLVGLLDEARSLLAERHRRLFIAAGAATVVVDRRAPSGSFGERLAALARASAPGTGLVVLGAGSVPRLTRADARRLVATAAAGPAVRRALTNNRYSSDVCAISDVLALRDLPPIAGDNVLPRWLAEHAGFAVTELSARERLALDLDAPLDLALLALAPRSPRDLSVLAGHHGLAVPRLEELRALLGDARRELLIFGRASSSGLAHLERSAACRIRFLVEERGLRGSSPLAQARLPGAVEHPRPPRATVGRLLAHEGPGALGRIVAELADGALLDSRVLLADRLGADESAWPAPDDRFASDLLRPSDVVDPWLRELTRSAASAAMPILLGGHTLVGPGLRLLSARVGGGQRRASAR